jgi:hypothetical protein
LIAAQTSSGVRSIVIVVLKLWLLMSALPSS